MGIGIAAVVDSVGMGIALGVEGVHGNGHGIRCLCTQVEMEQMFFIKRQKTRE